MVVVKSRPRFVSSEQRPSRSSPGLVAASASGCPPDPLPVVLSLFGGRQVNFNLNDGHDTGQLRMQLWSSAMEVFKTSPVFGVGLNRFSELARHVAQCVLYRVARKSGFFWGTLLVGQYYYCLSNLVRLASRGSHVAYPETAGFVTSCSQRWAASLPARYPDQRLLTLHLRAVSMATACVQLANPSRPCPTSV